MRDLGDVSVKSENLVQINEMNTCACAFSEQLKTVVISFHMVCKRMNVATK